MSGPPLWWPFGWPWKRRPPAPPPVPAPGDLLALCNDRRAALAMGRRFIGIEKDPHYHQIALSRLAGVDGPLFAAAPAPEEDPA